MNKKMGLIGFFCIFTLLTPAHARLGENGPEIVQRYGAPTKDLGLEGDDIRRFMFEKDNVSIRVTFQGTDSVEEIYRTLDGTDVSVSAINALLKANAGNSHWKPTKSTDQEMDWERDDGQAVAVCTKPGNVLIVSTKRYFEKAARQSGSSGDGGAVNGF